MSIFSRVFAKLNGPGTTGDAAFEKQVRNDGIDHASSRIAELVNEKIYSREVAHQFVLEELDAARNGHDIAVAFALNSGFSPYEYIGALEKMTWEGEESELEHVQLLLRHFGAKISDIDLRVELGINVVDKIMQKWELGKYKSQKQNSSKSVNNQTIRELPEDHGGIITSPFGPTPELQTETGVHNYISKLSKLTRSDLCAELSCVMAAKYNIMSGQAGLNDYTKKQELVNDLNDKAVVILMSVFGQSTVLGFAGGNMRSLNELVQNIDEEVAHLDLNPDQHGNLMLSKLSELL